MAGAVYALLVGIDAYKSPVSPLSGCVGDLDAFERLLRHRLDGRPLHLRSLRDAEATRAAVIAGFREHLAAAGPEDVAVVHYSGHGSQELAPEAMWALEPDHLNETLVLVDSRRPGGWDLADKEISVLLGEVAGRCGHVLVVLDSCHSGSGTRAADPTGVRARWTAADERPRPLETYLRPLAGSTEAAPPGSARRSGWSVDGRHVLLAACRAGETAKECRAPSAIGGGVRGALSIGLERALQGEGAGLTYRELHRWVAGDVRTRVPDQEPQLETAESADLDRPFLGGAVRRVPATFTMTRERDRGWVLDGGAVHGLAAPRGRERTHLAVLDPAADDLPRSTGSVLAGAVVTTVSPGSAGVDVDPADAVAPARSYPALLVASPLPRVHVRLTGDTDEVAALTEALAPRGSLLVVADETATLEVRTGASGAVVERPMAEAPRPVRVPPGADLASRTADVLGQMARWLVLAGLRNPASSLPAEVVRVDLTGPEGPAVAGRLDVRYAATLPPPRVQVALTSAADRTVWCALLDLTETYGVYADAFPAGAVQLEPGEKVQADLQAELPDGLWAQGVTQLRDLLKVVVSTEPLDARLLAQPELDLDVATAAPVVRRAELPATTLDRLMARVLTRGVAAQPADGERIADWTASELTVVVHRPAG